jgi:protein-S-isoprenylcysteine O-methyltransferase Ste14
MPQLRKIALYRRFTHEPLRRKQPVIKLRQNDKTLAVAVSVVSSLVLLGVTISMVLLTILEMSVIHVTISVVGVVVMGVLQAMAIYYFINRMQDK